MKCSVERCDAQHYCRGFCRKHHGRFVRHGSPLLARDLKPREKTCALCKQSKDRKKDFYKSNHGKCKKCTSTIDTCRRRGITLDTYFRVLDAQDNACAVCGKTFDDTVPCLDHDHTTGKPRGFVCGTCNQLVGCLERLPVDAVSAAYRFLACPPFIKFVVLLCLTILLATPVHAVKRVSHRKPQSIFRLPAQNNLQQQNIEINRLGLSRIADDRELAALIEREELVRISTSQYVMISCKLPENRQYVRPWVDEFLQQLGADYYAVWGKPIQVNSAVRTVKVQLRLLRWNRNAAPAHGEKASAHLAGVAVDLQRRGMTKAQIRWMEWRLMYYYGMGRVLVEEEIRQPCFHIVVLGPQIPDISFAFNSLRVADYARYPVY